MISYLILVNPRDLFNLIKYITHVTERDMKNNLIGFVLQTERHVFGSNKLY